MQLNDIDRMAMRDYVIGLGWCLLSIFGTFFVIFFEKLPVSIHIAHAPGFGIGQTILTILGVVNIMSSLWYLWDTHEKQTYLGQ